jgi:NADPH-dependent glutamate synthase beta subunit-like oxidoreductase
MSDQSTKITVRRVDAGVAVIGAGPAGLVLFGDRKDRVAHEKGCSRP